MLGAANIGLERVLPAMQRAELCEVVAVALRNPFESQGAVATLGIPHSYGSYEELLADPTIEAVYNPLPNELHVP